MCFSTFLLNLRVMKSITLPPQFPPDTPSLHLSAPLYETNTSNRGGLMQLQRLFAQRPAHPPFCPSIYPSRALSSLLRSFFLLLPSLPPPSSFPSHPFFPVTKLAVSLSICWFFLQRPCTCSHLLSCWPPLPSSPLSPLYLSLSLFLSSSLPHSAWCDAARPRSWLS